MLEQNLIPADGVHPVVYRDLHPCLPPSQQLCLDFPRQCIPYYFLVNLSHHNKATTLLQSLPLMLALIRSPAAMNLDSASLSSSESMLRPSGIRIEP